MTTVVGIDVSKKTLDICVLLADGKQKEFQAENTEERTRRARWWRVVASS